MSERVLEFFHSPNSVAIVGASDNPDKVGGRPVRYLLDFGFAGRILPVNPSRVRVQGVRAYGDLGDLREAPDVAVIAVSGQAAVDAVAACAILGVKGCVVMASGFAETTDLDGRERQEQMVAIAESAGMRLIGPNSQGIANFATGSVLSFSTMFAEQAPLDGPVAVISQSGAMSAVPYGLLRRRGIGVRYVHATGNDADVGVGELTEAVLADEHIRLVLLYIEDMRNPEALGRAARLACDRDVPIVALVGGRTAEGKRAAMSHTGALANERRVVEAFLERCGIYQVGDTPSLIAGAEVYLKDWRPRGRRTVIVSSSGAVCVLGADAAEQNGLELTRLRPHTVESLSLALPAFATKTNPVDVTATLLTDSTLFGKVLPALNLDPGLDACLVGIPVSGRGYDLERIACDIADFEAADDRPVVVSTPQPRVAAVFRQAGLVVFDEEATALAALGQLISHHELMDRGRSYPLRTIVRKPTRAGRAVSEWQALQILKDAGIATVDMVLCATPSQAATAFSALGGRPVAVKACPSEGRHKSDLGLVRLNVLTAADAADAAESMLRQMARLQLASDGVLLAPMVAAQAEAFVGAHVDPAFGPVVMIGAGGKFVELSGDVQVLLPPFGPNHVLDAIDRLAIAPLLAGGRGDPPVDVEAWSEAAVRLGRLILGNEDIVSVDVNPLMLGSRGRGAVAVDAVVVRSDPVGAG